jgi:hypothetical protein
VNNRTQQRMDKSIREAVASESARRDARTAEIVKKNQVIARERIPVIERLLTRGDHQGDPLTKEQRADLVSHRAELRACLGLTKDRKLAEMPTTMPEVVA